MATSIPLHFGTSRKSSLLEKVFVVVLCTSVLLMTTALAIYTFVDIDYRWYETSFGEGPTFQSKDLASTFCDPRSVAPRAGVTPYADPHFGVTFIATHPYATYAALLFEMGLVLLVLSVYVKSKFL